MRVVVFLLLTSSCSGFFDRKQFVGVKGRLTCNGKPAKGVRVTYHLFDFHHPTAFDDTNENGAFKLKGRAIKIQGIKPLLKINSNCNNKNPLQNKTITKEIPWNPSKYLPNIGVLELSTL
ncbi:Transthyretin-like family protein [Ancylostoma caninum]|uniref:Transthyretin-like family protein n=1 Tax=Ancylostoma caninum TaxID=29170 RepID=A0A368G0K0_ANCCA|nr:Transthyretin-like family protein [Ancylostoma caninum]